MGKFNKDAFVSKMATGAGLLNDVSRMEKAKRMEEIYVEADQIHPAKENQGISITKIEELAQAIQDVGLLSPLIVRQREDGEYKLVAGERRYRAIKMNIENGKWEKDDPIRCFLFDPEKIDLALSDEDKEEYVRLVENSNQRDKTDGDKLREIQKLKKIYEKLRREGDFSGSTRDHLVEDTGLSPSTIAQYTKVENQGSDELIDAVLENRVGISAAYKDSFASGRRTGASNRDSWQGKSRWRTYHTAGCCKSQRTDGTREKAKSKCIRCGGVRSKEKTGSAGTGSGRWEQSDYKNIQKRH